MTTNGPLSGTHDTPAGSPALINSAVRAELARAGITGRQLAREIGMTRGSLSRRLTGAVAWSVVELHAVARHLGVDPDCLFSPRPAGAPAPVAVGA